MTTEVGTLQFKTETRDIVRAEKEIARLEKEVAKIEKSQQRAAAQAVKLSNSKIKVARSAARASKEFKAVGFEFMKVNIEAKKTAQAVTQVEAATEQATREMDRLESAAMKGRGGFRAMRGSTAQLGMQIQDMAVQAQMGTNSLVILGQQGPQIASLFGPGGAILGAFVAIGAAIANVAFGSKSAAEEIDKLQKASDAVDKVFSRTSGTAVNLTQELIELSQRSKELAQIQLAVGIAEAEVKFAEATSRIKASLTELGIGAAATTKAYENLGQALADDTPIQELDSGTQIAAGSLRRLAETLGVTREQALPMVIAFKRMNDNATPENIKAYQEAVFELGTSTNLSSAELREFVQSIVDNADAALTAQQVMDAYNGALDVTGIAARQSTKALMDSIDALELRAETVGMSARQEALYRVEQSKASDFEKAVARERINTAFDTIDAKNEELKARKAAIRLSNEESALTARFAAIDLRRLDQQAAAREREARARDTALQAAHARVQGIIAMNDTEQEAFDRMIENKRTKLEEDYKAGLILEAEYQQAKSELIEAEANRRAENEKRIAAERTKFLLSLEDAIMDGKTDRAKAAFRLGVNLMNEEKRQNAERIISESYVAAMKAYSALAKINIIGPALGAAAAAAVLATGTAYAAGALSGRALGGQVRPGESYIVGERGPEVLTMGNAGGRITTNEAMGGGTSLVYSPTVNISGGATEQDRALFSAQLRQQKAEIADLLARRRF